MTPFDFLHCPVDLDEEAKDAAELARLEGEAMALAVRSRAPAYIADRRRALRAERVALLHATAMRLAALDIEEARLDSGDVSEDVETLVTIEASVRNAHVVTGLGGVEIAVAEHHKAFVTRLVEVVS